MEKLLTVSVAAYNMEKYLRKTLESLALPEAVDRMEVFVVDDGGSDGSLSIAREFEARYPQCFHAIHKENGGYGTTVNWSLTHATGRYFRPLDGDDWFDRDGLLRLLDVLETAEADAIYTPHIRAVFESDDSDAASTVLVGASLRAATFEEISHVRELKMHRLTYRTDVLRAARLELPAGILYTDSVYVCEPLAAARTLLTLDFPLYCHRMGREEQSVSSAVRARHVEDSLKVGYVLAERSRAQREAGGPNLRLMEDFSAYINRGNLRLLFRAEPNSDYAENLRRYDAEIRKRSPEIYADAEKIGKFGRVIAAMRRTNYRFARMLRPLIVRFMKNHP